MIPEAAVEAATAEVERVLDGELIGGAADTLARLILEAAAPYMLAEAKAKPPKHQCEPWQIQVNGSGTYRYCAACGEPQP